MNHYEKMQAALIKIATLSMTPPSEDPGDVLKTCLLFIKTVQDIAERALEEQ